MAELQTLGKGNPEALHDIGYSTQKMVADNFVNPGIPEAPLVTRDQMTQSTIKGNGADVLKANIIK